MPGRRLWVFVLLASGMAVPSARAQCTYTALASGTAVTTSAEPHFFSFNQTSVFYSAVAVRPAPGDDWNLEVYQSTAASPGCVATLLGGSALPTGVDFVIGDFNGTHNPTGFHYPRASRVAGAGAATVEWDDGANSIAVNGPLLSRSTGASDVIEVWDLSLSAGVTYTFTFNRTGADLKLLLFKSGPGAYWAGRNVALFEVTGDHTYTPPSSGFHGVAVINDDGAAGSYTLGIGTCDSPSALTSGTTVTTTRAEKYYSFNQQQPFWTAVGVRGSSNWEIAAYGLASGGAYPACLGDSIVDSRLASPTVDFVAGNFNEQFTGTRYPRVYLDQHLGSGTGTVEWDDGGDILVDGDPPINRSTGATDVLEAWDVYLENTQNYNITFTTSGADLKLFLFPPDVLWAGRSNNVLQLSGSPTPQTFSPGLAGWYGVVVVNDNGVTGSYSLGFGSTMVGVEDEGRVTVTELRRIAPNPARGEARFLFALRDPGVVSFQIIDVTGRVVAGVPPRQWDTGRWSLAWDGHGTRGDRIASGVYFVRMMVGNQLIARRKLVLLQ